MKFGTGCNHILRLLAMVCMAALVLPFAGCDGDSGSSSPSSPRNPVPRVTSLAPSSALAGSREITLSVFGENFISSSVVRWDGSTRATEFVTRSKLTATITHEDLSSAGEKSITVFNPAPGGGTSSSALFRITVPPPLEILTASLPAAHNSKGYSYRLKAGGGIPSDALLGDAYSWSIVGGSLPNGLSLSDGGEISGTPPVVAGDTNTGFDIQLSDFAFEPNTLTQSFNILVRADNLGRNETCGSASPISNGVLTASISPLGDIDVYSFQGTEGNEVEIETYAHRELSGGATFVVDNYLDTYIELLNTNCARLTHNDDITISDNTDSLISDFVLPYTGTYYIRISDLRGDGRPDFPYELHLSGAD